MVGGNVTTVGNISDFVVWSSFFLFSSFMVETLYHVRKGTDCCLYSKMSGDMSSKETCAVKGVGLSVPH